MASSYRNKLCSRANNRYYFIDKTFYTISYTEIFSNVAKQCYSVFSLKDIAIINFSCPRLYNPEDVGNYLCKSFGSNSLTNNITML